MTLTSGEHRNDIDAGVHYVGSGGGTSSQMWGDDDEDELTLDAEPGSLSA